MPKTTNLGLYYMSSESDLINDFIEANVEGNSNAEKIEDAYNGIQTSLTELKTTVNEDIKEQLTDLEDKVDETIDTKLETKQDKLTAGAGITISSDGTISVSYEEAEGVGF